MPGWLCKKCDSIVTHVSRKILNQEGVETNTLEDHFECINCGVESSKMHQIAYFSREARIFICECGHGYTYDEGFDYEEDILICPECGCKEGLLKSIKEQI